jgi:hypothetical protein
MVDNTSVNGVELEIELQEELTERERDSKTGITQSTSLSIRFICHQCGCILYALTTP